MSCVNSTYSHMTYITIYKSFVQHKQRDNLFGFVLIRVKRLARVLIDMKQLLQITLKLEFLKYFVHDDICHWKTSIEYCILKQYYYKYEGIIKKHPPIGLLLLHVQNSISSILKMAFCERNWKHTLDCLYHTWHCQSHKVPA